ncbi:putative Acetyl-coenzyme A synthetase 2 [Cardiosporidium cionae]|uniref:Acetyl-coenzyme A synthetase n=1 Tax=Cardiosporidium cionae TaxID=476202 RepID=A0ABQ7JAI4_9APIC|nr:putative Acetyl-coenzyme A synthetase 2 [Cardiosporidium cionae]|eukprot:KAF8821006.1 putative Acetyl-coenzyme A synthetase 2 [Cardiosporidium cionae]
MSHSVLNTVSDRPLTSVCWQLSFIFSFKFSQYYTMEKNGVENDSSEIMEEAQANIENIEKTIPQSEIYDIAPQNKERCHIFSREMYDHMYYRSIHDADNFWKEMALENLRWISPFNRTTAGSLLEGDFRWFINGKLNVCDNCVDRWAEQFPDRIAIIWEGDDPEEILKITYRTLLMEVCRFANMLKQLHVHKGDTVCIYMPMIPEVAYAMLACARIGAAHNVVFAGFSSQSLQERILMADSQIIITADQGIRGGKIIPLKDIADEALKNCPNVKHCIIFKRIGKPINFVEGRDIMGKEYMAEMRPYCPIETMDSEDLFFMLFTSGSTGKPKGIAHTTAGYLLYIALSHKYVFDVHPGDIYACVADVGWITGHSYIVYGPLCNGLTTFIFESIPTYPDAGRYWAMIDRHKITQFYTAPTAIRALMRLGDAFPKRYDLSSLRVLGTVGEPINPEAWRWYNTMVGRNRCNIVDTYFLTESGGHVLTPFPGAIKTKPGCATVPFFGVEPVILDSKTGKRLDGNLVHGILCFARSWPGMMRTVFSSHQRMLSTYLKPYKGYYFSGDGVIRDKDGYLWITGRVDDTLNVSGHRLGAAEIEHALVQNLMVAEAAVVGYPHPVKGTGIFCYVTLKDCVFQSTSAEVAIAELKKSVRNAIGPIATPDVIIFSRALPKTRSGKIMRRILRKIAAGNYDDFGDVSALANGEVVSKLIRLTKSL